MIRAKLVLTKVTPYCSWDGRNADGRPIHARYNRGNTSIYIGNSPAETICFSDSRLLVSVDGDPRVGETEEKLKMYGVDLAFVDREH